MGLKPSQGLLPITEISTDGAVFTGDRAAVRMIGVGSVNPLVMDDQTSEETSRSLAGIAGRLENHQSLQLYTTARPIVLSDLVHAEREKTVLAAGNPGPDVDRAVLHRLAIAQEQSLVTHSADIAALQVAHYIITKTPVHKGRNQPDRSYLASESLRIMEGVRNDLQALDIESTPLDAEDVIALINTRTTSQPSGVVEVDRLDFTDPKMVRIGEDRFALTVCWATVPEFTWLGLPLCLTQIPCAYTYTTYLTGTDRAREKNRHARRYRRLFGVNRGNEQKGRIISYEAAQAEHEAADLNAQLAATAAGGVFKAATYITLEDTDPQALLEYANNLCREALRICDLRVSMGRFNQQRLWQSSLPLGLDTAKKTRKYVYRNVGDLFGMVGCECGSPEGTPIGYAEPGRTLERVDPFDPAHENHLTLISGRSGSGKTMAVGMLLSRWLSQGARGFIIDRAGHYTFLCSLLPQARSISIGPGCNEHTICPWDTPDPTRVPPEKISFLLALHQLLIGNTGQGGFDSLEKNLLEQAIRHTYTHAAEKNVTASERLLQQTLFTQADTEPDRQTKQALVSLAQRLHSFVGEGTYAYIADRETTIPVDSPLVAFDTRTVPEDLAGAIVFLIAEHVTNQIATRREEHLTQQIDKGVWAGKSFLVIDEAWKHIQHPAAGQWIQDLARRSRHLALTLVAISQQLSDFQGEHGLALLQNSTIRLLFRQEQSDLAYAKEALALKDSEIEQLRALKTVKGKYSTAYLINGTRGRGTVSIRVGPLEYWIASNEPVNDEPKRRKALAQAENDPWQALRHLAGS